MTKQADSPTTDSKCASRWDRRTFLKTVGAGTTVASFGGTAMATASTSATIDDAFDLSDASAKHEALVVFQRNDDVERLGMLAVDGFHQFNVLPIGFVVLTSEQIRTVATWPSVQGVYANKELEWHNDDARELTKAKPVQDGTGLNWPYTGESVHAAVLDTGTDGDHPDLVNNLQANWQFVGVPEAQDEPYTWADVKPADTDENGHGTHTGGSIAADGTQSDGQYKGMAPDADLTVYSIGATLLLVYIVSAWDHLIERKRDGKTDIQVVSNSYGPVTDGKDVDPHEPVNVAAWYAFQEGIVPLFSAGNSGPGEKTLSQHAKLPYTIGVAATFDETNPKPDRRVTEFSSRGRPRDFDGPSNYDRQTALENIKDIYDYESGEEPSRPYGVYRNGVGAPGNLVMSTLSPADALQTYPSLGDPNEQDGEIWYGKISGTSMSCPVTAGCVTLIIDAYQQNNAGTPDPIDVINTVEATATNYHPDQYTAINIGTGFVDAIAAAKRAETGNWATFAEASDSIIDN
ncbi:S8 family serine peptidase [Haladaptatus halobius]|uniref:S8 family serine peptidase n=1 Tax=Haladaptatus halobius TaxID=2884875 RepID=UPI001D09DA39|nr:S8 family serine peptidase [Haladaptatus halobius]